MQKVDGSSLRNIEDFLGYKLPEDIKKENFHRQKFKGLDQKDIQDLLDFHPPFLRMEKMAIFGDELVGSTSIGVGRVYPKDMEGHYNSTIYLAFAGRLMPSTATIHLAYFHPDTSPQAVEGKSIRLDDEPFNGGLLQAAEGGTTYYVETFVTKKKLNLVEVETVIMFGEARFGLIEGLRFVLTKKDSIFKAIVPPEVK